MSDTEIENKKRSLEQKDEIEIDLEQGAPLSKKQKRLLRKGKLDLAKLEEQNKEEGKTSTKSESTSKEDGEASSDKESVKDKKPVKIGVWVGNLSFDTSKDDLIRFITNKTFENPEYSKDLKDDEPAQVNEDDILRINLPTQGKDSKRIKGFAYIDFKTKNHQLAVIKLSEQNLNGRNLLIKNSESFEGRPSKEEASISKNPPSRILFVGNLSFDTTEDMLTQHFQHCGSIQKIRMATFQDTGKCKGFSFIDFKDEEGPTKALKDKSCKKLLNRLLRMEYGEDRSKRTPKQKNANRNFNEENSNNNEGQSFEKPSYAKPGFSEPIERPIRERSSTTERKPKKTYQKSDKPQARPKSSVALASAQRGSAAIVQSTGKKTTF